MNRHLNMSEHVESSLKKAVGRINLLKSMRPLLDSNVAAKIYNVMILPVLTQCPYVTCGSTPVTLENKIKSAENRTQRIIGKSPTIPSLTTVKEKRVVDFVHRCLTKHELCENFENYFTLRSSKINTRNNNVMANLPPVRLEVARKSFYFHGAKIYNNLPIELRREKDYSKFRSLLRVL